VDNSRRDVCNRGGDPPIGLDGASPHAHDPATHLHRLRRPLRSIRRRHPDGQNREQSRQSLYREARQVAEAVDGALARARIDELERRLAERQAELEALEERLRRAVAITTDKQHEFTTVAQAEGVSLGVARRLLQVMSGPGSGRAVATLGRATLDAGKKAGPLLEVLDEAVRPAVKQAAAAEIFLAADPS
jgi:hypothetical protein